MKLSLLIFVRDVCMCGVGVGMHRVRGERFRIIGQNVRGKN